MFAAVDVIQELTRERRRTRRAEDELVSEARRILRNDLFAEQKILGNLKHYRDSFDVLDEEELDNSEVFTPDEIRKVAVKHRLKFLDSQMYKPAVPYAALMKIKQLNREHHKDLREFRILSCPQAFQDPRSCTSALLFAKTNCDNYYLIQRWGKKIGWTRRLFFWPLRTFENLLLTVILFTLSLTLSLPTALITLDSSAGYWSGYRAAAFFHLLIFNLGFTAYITFAFAKNFSSSVWDRIKDFG
jgi:hypothetical protein